MRRWKWLLAGVVVLTPVAGVVGWIALDPRRANERKRAAAEAALDRSDPGWRLDDILAARDAARPPADQNLTALCGDIDRATPKAFHDWLRERGDWLPPPDHNRLPSAEAVAAARAALAEARPAVDLAHTVRSRPTGGAPLVVPANTFSTLLDHAQRVRTVAAVLDADAALAAHDRDWPRALAAVADTLHACRGIGDEPLLISQLVRMAVAAIAVYEAERAVGWGEPPADGLSAVQAALLAEADTPRLAYALRGERAFMHRFFDNLDSGKLSLEELAGQTGGLDASIGWWSYRRRLPADQAYSLTFLSELLAIARTPTPEQADRFEGLGVPPNTPDTLLSRAMLPAYHRVTAAEWRTRARLQSAAVGLACERFRQKVNRWPNDLGELRDILPTIPLDPYDGQPLRYAKRDDGVVVYSVGPDRQDDGGTLSYGQPQPGEDVGFRLWDVTARRQPAEE